MNAQGLRSSQSQPSVMPRNVPDPAEDVSIPISHRHSSARNAEFVMMTSKRRCQSEAFLSDAGSRNFQAVSQAFLRQIGNSCSQPVS